VVRGVRIKDHWREQRLFDQRALVAGGVIVLLTCALVARLFWLQVVRHDYYVDQAQGNRVRTEPIPAARGLILDRNGAVLADNQPAYQLELVREEVANLDDTLKRLADIGLLDPDSLEETKRVIRSRRSFEGVPIRLHMSEDDIARFAVQRFEFPGVDIRTRLARSYTQGAVGVHALGYVGAISVRDLQRIDAARYAGTSTIGKLGVESTYEDQLHGENGFREVLVNAQGRSVQPKGGFNPDLKTRPPVAGADVMLSIDLNTQKVAEQALGTNRGAIVAIDPRNGDVLALASTPVFDPNMFARGLTRAEYEGLQGDLDKPLLNRALRGAYPPGSTVKPIVALAGLVNGVIEPSQTRFCPGYFMLPGSSHRFRDWKPQGHGTVDMVRAISQSCDIYFYALADMLGVDRLSAFMGHFGFGQPTGLDIGGERPGILPSKQWKTQTFSKKQDQVWFPGETVIFGIGQGYLTATPIQLAHAASIIASRGKSYRPRLVTALRDPITAKVVPVKPTLLEDLGVGTPQQWDIVYKGMYGVTHGGTASRSQAGAPYDIAGKTGTAQIFTVAQNQKAKDLKVEERLRDHAWFIAFAPIEDPKIAVAVLVENGGSGSGVAAPIARKVIDAWLLGKPPEPVAPPAEAPAEAPAPNHEE
jgi:penicillin-binding protein 2